MIELEIVAKIVKSLYLPVLWIVRPARRPPTVFPSTAGKRCEPAAVLEAFAVTRKYRGTLNIMATWAAVWRDMMA